MSAEATLVCVDAKLHLVTSFVKTDFRGKHDRAARILVRFRAVHRMSSHCIEQQVPILGRCLPAVVPPV